MIYLNTYETEECYGGPEEGGWWFTAGTPVQSVLVSDEDDLDAWRESQDSDKLREMCQRATLQYTQGRSPQPADTGYGGYTFAVGSDEPVSYRQTDSYTSFFEDHFAKPYPEERPHYC